jgi:hypothetical protein
MLARPSPGGFAMIRRMLAAFVLGCAPFAVQAADEENPYKNSKAGDYATFKFKRSTIGFDTRGTLIHTVVSKSDKEVKLKLSGTIEISGTEELPVIDNKVDLTKPFDPSKAVHVLSSNDAKVKKLKEGKEKIKVGDKEYDCTWTTYKVTFKDTMGEGDAEVKTWVSKDVPGGLVKMTVDANRPGGGKWKETLELTETGNKK